MRPWQVSARVFRRFASTNPARHGAALAYYGLFALVPILAVGYELLLRLLQDRGPALLEQFRGPIVANLDPETLGLLQARVQAATSQTRVESSWISLIGLLVLIYAASGAFAQLKYSLNSIWGIPYVTQLTTTRQILTRLLGMSLVLVVGLGLVGLVVLNFVLGWLSTWLGLGAALPGLQALLTFGLGSLLFAVLYKLLPDASVRWTYALLGGAVSAGFILVALALASALLSVVPPTSVGGIGGGLAVILIGINYSAQMFLLGAVLVRLMGEESGGS